MSTEQRLGGTEQSEPATQEIQSLCDEVKDDVVKISSKDIFNMYQAVNYKSQVVAGLNHFVKIQVTAEGECIHVRLHEPLPFNNDTNKRVLFHGIQEGKTMDDDVAYFEETVV